jgi:hypothetical protein
MGLFDGKELTVTITPDRAAGAYAPGDSLQVTIVLAAPDGGKVRAASAGLVLWQHTKTTTREGGSVSIQESTNENWVQKEQLLHEQALPKNFTQSFTFDWTIPAEAQPGSSDGENQRRLLIKVMVDRPMAKDVQEELEILVTASQGSS